VLKIIIHQKDVVKAWLIVTKKSNTKTNKNANKREKMKSLKLIEQLFEAQIRAFEEHKTGQDEEHQKGLIEGLEIALREVRHEIKKLQDKK